ncbi:hypothetical protein DL93DRAFT_2066735 [Clavulina sp. PMI_390]|nr:hypothetical protein DL93DRAFT_2066735 [Clavulina sp. PMI_390]
MLEFTVDIEASPFHQVAGGLPSPHLQRTCPLCFGMTPQMLESILGGPPDATKDRFAALVCLDGNFDHRRLRHAGSGDQPIPKAFTYMLSAAEVAATKQVTEDAIGNTKQPFAEDEAEDPDVTLPGLGLPEHIYSSCKKRFFAANQDNKKGEPSVFSDTGLMALVCRHDRVLFMANLRDAGERRYYALALLKRLFQELPTSWTAGVLYDIGCQLHRTITKHNLVPEFSSRVGWGVSVFHAFGHEAACQALYHPQKCNGFGCTDGEGCERCWALLQKLTGVLRQFHRRLHVLDQHIRYMNDSNYANLGLWLHRKMDAVVTKKALASARVEESGRSKTALCLEWRGQKSDAIEQAPSASKTAAAKTASGIISMMDSLQQLDGLIKAAGTATTSEQGSPELLNLSLTLEDLAELRIKLQLRIQKAIKQLLGKDAATASAVQKSMKSDFLMKRMWALAIRLKIKQQVRDVLMMSEPFRRRTLRDRKGKYAKIRQQTANSISRKTPGIKALARRYNSMCQELSSHAKKRYYPNASIPLPLDVAELFNPEANAAMWMDSVSDDSNPADAPPAYLTDPAVQSGIMGWLGLQRCKEEESRLLGEMRRLVGWISEEIDAVDKALSLCEGKFPGTHHIAMKLC